MTEQLVPADLTLPAARGADRRAAVMATVDSPAAATGAALRQLPGGVAGIEVRADLAGDIDPARLRDHVPGRLVYALRSHRYGGAGPGAGPDRQARLLAAAAGGYDLVDLECHHDLVPEILAAVPPGRRRISWYGADGGPADLRRRFQRMAAVPAALYQLAPQGRSFPAALATLRLLGALRRDDVTAFGTVPAAAFTRVLAPWLGAPVVYGSPAGPTVDQLLTDYPFPRLPVLTDLLGIVGRAVKTSLFLRLVNTALAELSIPSLFLPFVVPDPADFSTQFLPAVAAGHFEALGLPLRALTVAAPYKPAAFAAAPLADRRANAAQAANLLLRADGGRWQAVTTDGSAVLAAVRDALSRRPAGPPGAAGAATGGPAANGTGTAEPLAGVPVAVIGCGAAGRAAAAAFSDAGAAVTLVNRGLSRGRAAASRLGLPFVPLDGWEPGRFAVLVHATPVADTVPFPVDDVRADAVVADFVSAAEPTALASAARARGLTTIDGGDIVVHEVTQQFQLMTGRPMPGAVRSSMDAGE